VWRLEVSRYMLPSLAEIARIVGKDRASSASRAHCLMSRPAQRSATKRMLSSCARLSATPAICTVHRLEVHDCHSSTQVHDCHLSALCCHQVYAAATGEHHVF
jgi:hypothetical protein